MEYEKDANFSNFTFDEEISPESSMVYICHEVVFTLFTIVGMFADVAIIYVFLRFQRMRKTENMFIANWAIADFGTLLFAPSGYRIISVMDNLPISPEFMCTLFHLGQTLQSTTVIFSLFLCIDWFLATYFEKTNEKFRQSIKYCIGAIWILTILVCSIATGYCLHDKYLMFSADAFIVLFFMLLSVTVVLQISRAVRKFCLKRTNICLPALTLNIATVQIASYVLAIFTLLLTNIVSYHPLVGMIAEILIFSCAIINFIMLYNLNGDFHDCFLQALRRGNYETKGYTFDNPITNRVYDKCSVPISISVKDDSQLLNNEVY